MQVSMRNIIPITSLALALLLAPLVWAEGAGGSGRNYDPSTEITVKGTVAEIKAIDHDKGGKGLHLTLNSSAGTFDVHVGPAWYLEDKGIRFAKGDEIEVVGSKVKVDGNEALIARSIKSGELTWTLRDAKGIPAWSGGRRNK